jgi:hypothetical protein
MRGKKTIKEMKTRTLKEMLEGKCGVLRGGEDHYLKYLG